MNTPERATLYKIREWLARAATRYGNWQVQNNLADAHEFNIVTDAGVFKVRITRYRGQS